MLVISVNSIDSLLKFQLTGENLKWQAAMALESQNSSSVPPGTIGETLNASTPATATSVAHSEQGDAPQTPSGLQNNPNQTGTPPETVDREHLGDAPRTPSRPQSIPSETGMPPQDVQDVQEGELQGRNGGSPQPLDEWVGAMWVHVTSMCIGLGARWVLQLTLSRGGRLSGFGDLVNKGLTGRAGFLPGCQGFWLWWLAAGGREWERQGFSNWVSLVGLSLIVGFVGCAAVYHLGFVTGNKYTRSLSDQRGSGVCDDAMQGTGAEGSLLSRTARGGELGSGKGSHSSIKPLPEQRGGQGESDRVSHSSTKSRTGSDAVERKPGMWARGLPFAEQGENPLWDHVRVVMLCVLCAQLAHFGVSNWAVAYIGAALAAPCACLIRPWGQTGPTQGSRLSKPLTWLSCVAIPLGAAALSWGVCTAAVKLGLSWHEGLPMWLDDASGWAFFGMVIPSWVTCLRIGLAG
jgi:hypothetical protein